MCLDPTTLYDDYHALVSHSSIHPFVVSTTGVNAINLLNLCVLFPVDCNSFQYIHLYQDEIHLEESQTDHLDYMVIQLKLSVSIFKEI